MSANDELAQRLERLQDSMALAGVDLVAIAPTPNMRYLLGFAPHADERPCFLLVGRRDIGLVVPSVNAVQVEARTGRETLRWQDELGPQEAIQSALASLDIRPGAVLAADDTMRADALLLLQELARPSRSVPAGQLMAPLRIRKSPAEVAALAVAAEQADHAMRVGAGFCRPGVTELAVAERIAADFRQAGADSVDFTIVGSGPNGAFPHHETGDRLLQEGDTIVLDIGATFHSYKSDITRVVHLGQPSPELEAVYAAVLEANRRGRAAAIAGARARDVDRAARGAIEEAGLGPYFVHRTGHGLGMEGHEPPWITSESDTVLEPGMVFSVEPGVYLPGKFGVRIEDIVVVTEGQAQCLTGASHDLIINL